MTTADETAASYGLFQVAYASLDQGITNALVALMRAKNEALAFDLVASIPFRVRQEKLDALTKTLDQQSEYAQHLRAALRVARQVSEWRNARVHPRVEFLDGIRPVLVGKKDGKPLEIDAAACWERIQEISTALSELDAYTDRLVNDAKILEEMMNGELAQGW